MSQQFKSGREWEYSINRMTPNTRKQPMEWRKKENIVRQKERADEANRKALALLIKPATSTRLNTESLRSFHGDTERAQSFCSTEKFYSEKVKTSAYEQPKRQE